ncbi:MAG TPA: TolC family protein, partial [Tepidisphaeraceae bacterium]|nr:TolC family protein [Tepidisphaeraceae bacterium]
MSNFISIRGLISFTLLIALTGCTVHPPGEREERIAVLESGKPFDKQIQPLPENPTPDQIVEYALLNNAELQQHYWEWRSAIEQIPQDATQTSTLNIAAGTSITNGHTSWGSSTVALANDPMTDIKWPEKLDAVAKQTLANAKAAGQRFIKAKYDLRNKVLSAYYDYALNAELIRLAQSNQQLLQTTATVTEARNRAGSSGQSDMLKASNEVDMSRNDIANMESQLPSQRAAINALLSRPPNAPLPLPSELPPLRSIAYDDGELLDLAAKQNPELLALADEIRGRNEGIRLAKLQYVPDFNLSVGTDLMGITQSVLGQATIPFFRYEAINAAIAQAEANLRVAEAMRRQAGNDLSAQVIADITIIRDAERQLDLFEHTILPRARQIVNISRSTYETGHASLLDVLDDQRSLIAIERLI